MKKTDKIMGLCWILNIILLIVIIAIPKDNKLYNSLYMVFMLSIFLFPLLLVGIHAIMRLKNKEELTIFNAIPHLGCILIMLLTFIKFIQAIEKFAVFQMVIIMITFIVAEILLGFIVYKFKNMTKKQYIWLNVGTYVTLVVFFFCAMIMSYDYSIIW